MIGNKMSVIGLVGKELIIYDRDLYDGKMINQSTKHHIWKMIKFLKGKGDKSWVRTSVRQMKENHVGQERVNDKAFSLTELKW